MRDWGSYFYYDRWFQAGVLSINENSGGELSVGGRRKEGEISLGGLFFKIHPYIDTYIISKIQHKKRVFHIQYPNKIYKLLTSQIAVSKFQIINLISNIEFLISHFVSDTRGVGSGIGFGFEI